MPGRVSSSGRYIFRLYKAGSNATDFVLTKAQIIYVLKDSSVFLKPSFAETGRSLAIIVLIF